MRVIAQADGTCPSCSHRIADEQTVQTPQEIAAAKKVENANPATIGNVTEQVAEHRHVSPTDRFDPTQLDQTKRFASLRWELVRRFELAWLGEPHELADFVATLPSELDRQSRRIVLEDVVICDLENRWGVTAAGASRRPKPLKWTLNDYARLLPELVTDGRLPVRLQAAEFRIKQEAGQKVQLEEYLDASSVHLNQDARELVDELLKGTAPRPVACRNLWLAIAACLVVLCVDVVASLYFGRRLSPVLFMAPTTLSLFITSLSCLLVGHLILNATHSDDRHRVVGMRLPSLIHSMVILLLVVPGGVCVGALADVISRIMNFQPQVAVAAFNFQWLYRAQLQLAMEPWMVLILVGCIMPAFAEELFMRGLLGRGLIHAYGVVPGILITSLLFGLMHVAPDLIAATFMLGIVLHIVYLTTKSIIAPMILHALHNLAVLSLSRMVQQGRFNPTQAGDGVYFSTPLVAWSFTLLVALLLLLYRTRTSWLILSRIRWEPGFVSAERPPTTLPARPKLMPAARWVWALCSASVLLFAVACWDNAISWMALDQGNRAMQLADQGNVEAARKLCQQALTIRPRLASLHVCHAWVLLRAHSTEEALRTCEESMRLDGTIPLAYVIRASIRHDDGYAQEALADCNKALRLNASASSARAMRAGVWLQLNNPQKAILDARLALLQDPQNSMAKLYRGQAYVEVGSPALAFPDLNDLIRQDPKDFDAYFWRSRAFEGQGNFQEAFDDLTQCIELRGLEDFLRKNRSRLWLQMKNATEALQDLEVLLQVYPEDDEIISMRNQAQAEISNANLNSIGNQTRSP